MTYKLNLIKNNGFRKSLTPISGNLSWKDSIDTLGMELSFDIARRDDKVEIGDKIIMYSNNKEIFRGIIVDLGTEIYTKSITAFDYAFYLNKSKTIVQFNKTRADNAIRTLCSKFNIPIGRIVGISTPIAKIYKDDTISDIIKDILDQATSTLGIKYRLEMREGKLFIERYTELIVKPIFKSLNLDVLKNIGGISKSESISDMKNSILISSGDEKSSRVVATAKDNKNISKFGLLQDVESVDDKDIAKAKNIAKNKLKELNKIGEDISLGPLLGDDRVRAGRILELDNNLFGLKGKYLVKDCTHNYHNSIHTMNVTIEKVI
ncbi:XkdQ/YqbQ family protein [Tissierella creatinophila]|uniref:YqbQ/XkdQ domain-containing protein n=1 Tax=Tissierella creatinophila DSM 6911 TaxID=1123403 RepID=A0A1U7M4M6_TISCR|nr:hypothetical protein [Tissierella creatinophila]OLS02236.1 hypothetical protein TICRE_17880 [Tissierella creatinophila DSM 6911]